MLAKGEKKEDMKEGEKRRKRGKKEETKEKNRIWTTFLPTESVIVVV